jgi:hypothetical protein
MSLPKSDRYSSSDIGTLFLPTTINSEQQIHEYLIANYSPPLVPPSELEQAVDKILELYPDNPALGSPFNTGNETFGLSSSFKRVSAICTPLLSPFFHFLTVAR